MLEVIAHQKEVMNDVLRQLTSAFSTKKVYVAGGALRDHCFKKAASDIDIYLQFPEDMPDAEIFAPMLLEGILGDGKALEPKDIGYSNEHLHSVTEFYYRGEVVQIMFTNERPIKVIAKFPVFLSRIAYSLHKGLIVTPFFRKSVEEKLLYMDDYPGDKYYYKMINKFPDYPVTNYYEDQTNVERERGNPL